MDIQNLASGTRERVAVDGKQLDRYQVRLHVERYQFACRFAKGKDVLDVASGEGYGSNMLASADANNVYGMDIVQDVVAHAAQRYQRSNLRFCVGNAQEIDFPDDCLDLVVSFETIEHLPDYCAYLAEIKRVLRSGGIYLVSTPNRLRESPGYGPDQAVPNPHHVREFTRDELLPTLNTYFKVLDVYGQGLLHPILAPEKVIKIWRVVQRGLHKMRLARLPIGHIGMWGVRQWAGLMYNPAYFVVVCTLRD